MLFDTIQSRQGNVYKHTNVNTETDKNTKRLNPTKNVLPKMKIPSYIHPRVISKLTNAPEVWMPQFSVNIDLSICSYGFVMT